MSKVRKTPKEEQTANELYPDLDPRKKLNILSSKSALSIPAPVITQPIQSLPITEIKLPKVKPRNLYEIEYDMDDQDHQYLLKTKLCNFDYFEFVMDRLEKEWFILIN